MWVCPQVGVCGQVGVHVQVHTIPICHFSLEALCKYKRTESEAFWLLLFPGRVILFFQIRALTGLRFCMRLRWWWSAWGIIHLDPKSLIAHQESYFSIWCNGCNTNRHELVPCSSLPVRKYVNLSGSVPYIPDHGRTIFFPQVLASCRWQCLYVQITWVSVESLAITLDNLCWSWTGFYVAPFKDKNLPFLQKVLHFYKSKWIQWFYFISVKYQL